jgi:hypothetical protein
MAVPEVIVGPITVVETCDYPDDFIGPIPKGHARESECDGAGAIIRLADGSLVRAMWADIERAVYTGAAQIVPGDPTDSDPALGDPDIGDQGEADGSVVKSIANVGDPTADD